MTLIFHFFNIPLLDNVHHLCLGKLIRLQETGQLDEDEAELEKGAASAVDHDEDESETMDGMSLGKEESDNQSLDTEHEPETMNEDIDTSQILGNEPINKDVLNLKEDET